MTIRKLACLTLIPAFVSATLVGCGGASTQDTGAPTSPPITVENSKAAADKVNAGLGAGGKNGKLMSPGVK